MASLNLLALWRTGTKALGPGVRYCIWTQGCPFNCNNCTTPEGKAITEKMLINPLELAEDIISRKQITGITISGGEPFLQAQPLAELLKIVKSLRPDIDVLAFSGYKYEDLVWDEARELLSHLDLLIDGEYVDSLNSGIGLRGSSNQRFIFLTDRLKSFKEQLENGPRTSEMIITDDGIFAIGIPKHNNK